MELQRQNLIDQYLRGDLSGDQLASFQDLMNMDPSFKEEVLFEQHIQDGIVQYRKAELKSRLNSIDVAPEWYGIGSIGSSALIKTIGGAIAVVLIGALGFYALNDNGTSNDLTSTETYVTGEYLPEIAEVPVIRVPEIEESMDLEEVSDLVTPAERPMVRETNQAELVTIMEETQQEDDEFNPQVSLPKLSDVDSEEAIATGEVVVPEVSTSDEIETEDTPLDVKTVSRRSETIKYKYFDGKLFLYGDFGQEPYEILEINSIDKRNIYVYHGGNYYVVRVTDKVEELPQINSPKLREELEILRDKKLNK